PRTRPSWNRFFGGRVAGAVNVGVPAVFRRERQAAGAGPDLFDVVEMPGEVLGVRAVVLGARVGAAVPDLHRGAALAAPGRGAGPGPRLTRVAVVGAGGPVQGGLGGGTRLYECADRIEELLIARLAQVQPGLLLVDHDLDGLDRLDLGAVRLIA